MALVGICASLVECLSFLPLQAGLEDSVLQMNNRGNPENYGFIVPGSPNNSPGPSNPGTPVGGFPRGASSYDYLYYT
jgi:hypothetical protein